MALPQSPSRLIPTNRENSRFGKYRFPSDLGPNGMVLDFQQYSYAATSQGVGQGARTVTSIVLPLPQQIQDAIDVQIQQTNLGAIGAGLLSSYDDPSNMADAVRKALDAAGDAGRSAANGTFMSDLMGKAQAGAQYTKYASRNALDTMGIEGLSMATDLVSGTAVNPHTTLNFDGVNLKQFTFSWEFAPRNETESEELRNIIEKIKFHILPRYQGLPGQESTGNAGLDRALQKYPDLALVRFNGIDKNHFVQFKPGMISNFSVDYTPQGNVLVEGGKPAIVNVSFTLQEAQIHTQADARTESGGINTHDIDQAGRIRGGL